MKNGSIQPKQRTLIFIITIICSALSQISSDLYLPSLPNISSSLNTSHALVQLSLSSYLFGFALSQIIYGPISDFLGRKNPLISGILICAISSYICYKTLNIDLMIIARFFQGIGGGACASLARPIFTDLFEKKELPKYSSYNSIFGTILLSIAPLLGGYISHHIGWRANFIFLSIVAILLGISVIFFVPETNKCLFNRKRIKIKLFSPLLNKYFMGYTICGALSYGQIIIWLTLSTFILQNEMGLSSVEYGWIYLYTGAIFIVGSLVFNLLLSKLESKINIFISLILCSITPLTIFFHINGHISTTQFISFISLIFLSSSISFPASFVGAFSEIKHGSGIASAVFGVSKVLCGAIFSASISIYIGSNMNCMLIFLTISVILYWTTYFIFLLSHNTHSISHPPKK